MRKNFYFLIGFILFILFSCQNKKETPKANPQIKEIPVSVFKVKEPVLISFEMLYPGKTKSPAEVKVVARITGILQKRFFKEGTYVNKGDLLYIIEKDPYLAQYEIAKAQVERAQAELERAQRDWKRISEAVKVKLVSESERDKALSDLETARARLKEAMAVLKQAELNLKYTEVRAEISGITGKREVDEGNLVTPGTILTTLIQINPLYVEFSIPERDFEILGLTKGNYKKLKNAKVELFLSGETPYPFKGEIDFVDTKLDETSSLKVRALIPNPKGELLPQTFVRIKIRGFPKKVILVPQKAIMQGPKGSFVYLFENGTAKPKPVKIGLTYKDYYIVEEGLRPGDHIIIDNLIRLRPDIPVRAEKIIEENP